jgi:hypothetical protein
MKQFRTTNREVCLIKIRDKDIFVETLKNSA